MLKKLSFFMLSALLLTACSKGKGPEGEILEPTPVNKKVVYHVFAGKDYTHPVYDNTQTTVTLTVALLNVKTGATVTVWDSTLNGDLRSFPQQTQMTEIEKTFSVKEKTEQLQVAFSVRYNQDGHIQQKAAFEAFPGGTLSFLKVVNL